MYYYFLQHMHYFVMYVSAILHLPFSIFNLKIYKYIHTIYLITYVSFFQIFLDF
jgi:hypothetical protein